MYRKHNLADTVPPKANRETFATLFENGAVRVESIRSRLKTPGEWYNQEEDEWVLLVRGNADLEIGGEILHLSEGDHITIPRHTLHRVLSTAEDTYWIGVFSS